MAITPVNIRDASKRKSYGGGLVLFVLDPTELSDADALGGLEGSVLAAAILNQLIAGSGITLDHQSDGRLRIAATNGGGGGGGGGGVTTEYIGVAANTAQTVFGAADFTAAGRSVSFTDGDGVIPDWGDQTNRRIALARPVASGDLVGVELTGAFGNQLTAYAKQAGSVEIDGVECAVWVSNQAQGRVVIGRMITLT